MCMHGGLVGKEASLGAIPTSLLIHRPPPYSVTLSSPFVGIFKVSRAIIRLINEQQLLGPQSPKEYIAVSDRWRLCILLQSNS